MGKSLVSCFFCLTEYHNVTILVLWWHHNVILDEVCHDWCVVSA